MTPKALTSEFEAIVGKENVMAGESDLHSYSYDAAVLKPWPCVPRRARLWAGWSGCATTTACP